MFLQSTIQLVDISGVVPAALAPGGEAVQAQLEQLELLQQVLRGGAQDQARHGLSGQQSAQVSGERREQTFRNMIFKPS